MIAAARPLPIEAGPVEVPICDEAADLVAGLLLDAAEARGREGEDQDNDLGTEAHTDGND